MSKTPVDDQTKLLEELTAAATSVDEKKAETAEAQAHLEKVVFEARTAGVRYRQIAEATSRSVAWVQAVLGKLGFVSERSKKPLATKRSR